VRRWFLSAVQKMWPVARDHSHFAEARAFEKTASMREGVGTKATSVWPEFRSAVFGLCAEVMADQVQAAIDNGRELRQLMNEAGVRYVNALKTARRKT